MKNRMTMNQLSTYIPFWEEMKKRLSKTIERKEDLAEVQSILNRAYMKALEVGFEEGVKNMYSAQDMEAFLLWADDNGWFYGKLTEMWHNYAEIDINDDYDTSKRYSIKEVLKIWEQQRKEETK